MIIKNNDNIKEYIETVSSATSIVDLERKAERVIQDYFHKHHNIKPVPLEFVIENRGYSERVSNTHSCPRGGQTNWGGRVEGAPRGHPGLYGYFHTNTVDKDYLEAVHRCDRSFAFSDILRSVGINVGTGGLFYGWDCKIYQSDFPHLEEINIHIISDIIL